MTLKSFLLVSDDPDDHQAFSEAINGISDESVVLIVLDSERALSWLKEKKQMPAAIFLDLGGQGFRINSFVRTIQRDLTGVRIVAYGDVLTYQKIENSQDLIFFEKDYEYPQLQAFLRQLISDIDAPPA